MGLRLRAHVGLERYGRHDPLVVRKGVRRYWVDSISRGGRRNLRRRVRARCGPDGQSTAVRACAACLLPLNHDVTAGGVADHVLGALPCCGRR